MRRRTLLYPTALAALLALAATFTAQAQVAGGVAPPAAETLIRATAAPVRVAPGGTATAVVKIAIEPGWHVNANPPSPDYMVPTEVLIEPAAGVRAGKPAYPEPVPLKVGFEESPILVYGGMIEVQVPITAEAGATRAALKLSAKLRFQACNDQICLTPASVPFVVSLEVTSGAPGGEGSPEAALRSGATPERGDSARGLAAPGEPSPPGAPAIGSGFTTSPPAGGAAVVDNPIARAFDRGGAFAFFTIFLIGLALNLTPCVYPMLGVTVSIFGARRAAPPLQVFGLALVYVLGMAITYSTLGVIAALTGGLFGAFLQNPFVLIGIGLLMVLLALSMFGLYELQPPAWLLTKLGGSGATSAAGVFFSGLVVGVFAAPCIGPPVVALLALVGAKGDPWFGFAVFFTLSIGLGLPYLVLGTFSNLLQRLPRSGDWMVWVKKLFGVVLVGVGLFYGMLALAPKWAGWLLPLVLVAGGVYLGFLEKSAAARRGFQLLKRVTGAVAVAGGIFLLVATPTRGIAFASVTPAELEAALRRGDLVMVDFTADWCLACHELERSTFTDPRVRAAAKRFRAFRVDLTRFDSPESEAWRKRYGIAGLPTIVFLGPGGAEVRGARVEGFLPPSQFVERLRLAAGGDGEAARD